jgi:hypothetical protein
VTDPVESCAQFDDLRGRIPTGTAGEAATLSASRAKTTADRLEETATIRDLAA